MKTARPTIGYCTQLIWIWQILNQSLPQVQALPINADLKNIDSFLLTTELTGCVSLKLSKPICGITSNVETNDKLLCFAKSCFTPVASSPD